MGGLCALLTHASLTPYLSGVPWRHRAAQGLSALTAASSLAYGAHALPTTLPTTLPTLPTTRLATPPPLPPAPTDLPPSAHPKRRARTRTRKQPLTLSRLCYCPLGMLGERYASAALVLPALGFVATACGLGVVNVMVPHRLIAAAPAHHCTSAPLHPLAPPCTPLHPLHPCPCAGGAARACRRPGGHRHLDRPHALPLHPGILRAARAARATAAGGWPPRALHRMVHRMAHHASCRGCRWAASWHRARWSPHSSS